ncbi:MAG: DNA alkylation repair protein [Candidatus Kapabacteria bacterium]|nr:DNA alkylation repair protein [Candidatus Kapabacteria bacterium]
MSISVSAFVGELHRTFASHADAKRAQAMSAYMRDQFAFYGIDAPTRQILQREIRQRLGLPSDVLGLAHALWQRDEREMQYAACAILTQPVVQRALLVDDVPSVVDLITAKSWWDTVDVLAPNVIGSILRPLPDQLVQMASAWIESDNIWLQRTAIIMQLRYRAATNVDVLFDCILRRAASTEFFVRKGAGWALRQYAYTAPDAVRAFVEEHRNVLSGLTVREALKRIP